MIYFDAAATTKPSASVLSRFEEISTRYLGNPSSSHALGREAMRLVDDARKEMLSAFGLSKTHQAIFLSGASEANNLAIKGIAFQYQNRGKKILVSDVEHPSVIAPAQQLSDRFGFELVRLKTDEWGRVSPKTLEEAIDDKTILVSIMGVNNETGAVNDLGALANIVHRYPKCYFHSDLTQAIGKIDVPYSSLDLFSFSGHKIHGVKGSGALVYKSTIRFLPLIDGGGQEGGFRSGTVSPALCASLSLAVKETIEKQETNRILVAALKEHLLEGLPYEEALLNSNEEGSPYVVNFSLRRHKASVIVEALSEEGIYVSTASACSSKKEPYSEVLLAMGKPMEVASNAIRVSFDEDNTVEEVDAFLLALKKHLEEIRKR
ncbi:MAG: cysteine desulfurase [Bacilli bacterium]|nr:cysteine desulfurase [Bacilli bacterium]